MVCSTAVLHNLVSWSAVLQSPIFPLTRVTDRHLAPGTWLSWAGNWHLAASRVVDTVMAEQRLYVFL